jgi:hypothetical protein
VRQAVGRVTVTTEEPQALPAVVTVPAMVVAVPAVVVTAVEEAGTAAPGRAPAAPGRASASGSEPARVWAP